MNKTEKELAFLRDLYIETDYTERFTDVFDDNFKFSEEERILYVNAGTGNHALALRKKIKDEKEIVAVSENEELAKIARAKREAVNADINFVMDFPAGKFDAVLADASFVRPNDLEKFVSKLAAASNNQVAFFLPTASSFGEIFSLLWETLLKLDLLDKSAEIERLITDIPTVSSVEEMAKDSGLTRIETITKSEFFEFDNGAAFVNSPLAADFLFPAWLDFLSEEERTEVVGKFAETIDEDCQEMSFRFSVKATLLVGEIKQ